VQFARHVQLKSDEHVHDSALVVDRKHADLRIDDLNRLPVNIAVAEKVSLYWCCCLRGTETF
jgi:hypothetical protein